MSKRSATIKQIQALTGILNFLNRAMVPGRVFTRCMYSKLKTIDKLSRSLKQYHHVTLSGEFKKDCEMWETFLIHADATILCRPFTDSKVFATSTELEFFTDTSGVIGFGCFFSSRWTFGN